MAVKLEGAIELRKALRAFDPDLSKALTKEMAAGLKPVVKAARGYLPSNDQVLTNWSISNAHEGTSFPYYDYAKAKRGITYKTSPSKANSKGFRALASILNKNAAGAIFETAGRKNPWGQPWNPASKSHDYSHSFNPAAGRNFINAANKISKLYGSGNEKGRVIYRAWQEDQGRAQDIVIRAIERAAAKFYGRAAA